MFYNLRPLTMKKILVIFILFLAVFTGCDEPPVEKPEKLIERDKMIDMLMDIHLAEAAYTSQRNRDSMVMNSSSANFYYSILDKHQVQDTVFEKSFVFYASQPRSFEKMYRGAMNQLNEMDQEFSGRQNDEIEFDIDKKRQ